MRQFGSLPNEAQAQRLIDYLLSQGIAGRCMGEDDGFELWVEDDDHRQAASAELERFLTEPDHERYRQGQAEAQTVRKQEEKEQAEARKRLVDVKKQWMRQHRGSYPVTWALMALSIGATIVTGLGEEYEPVLRWLTIATYEIRGDRIAYLGLSDIMSGQVWRLVTPIFVHGGYIHIIFNMWWLRDLGGLVEARKGTAKMVGIVLVMAVVSNLGQYFIDGPMFFGMSGVVYGLLGYCWVKGQVSSHEGIGLQPFTAYIMLGFFLLGFGMPGVAAWAHGFGLVAGLALGYVPSLFARTR